MRSLPLISLIACLAVPSVATAQVSPPTMADVSGNSDEDPLEVVGDDILVLAPRITGQIDTPHQPIEVFSEEDIASYGVSSIEELLEAISPQTGSGRGRGGGRPVMLLNGQRISSFREMRNIPPEAIRRMEVLPEEVALRFGYAANQRVVNIILKDQFAAVTTAGEYNVPTRGGFDNYELEGGLFSVSGPRRYNVSAKFDHTTMITENERDIIQDGTRISDLASDPDASRYRSLAGKSSNLSLEGTMTQGIGEGGLGGALTVTGGYSRSSTVSYSGLDTIQLSQSGQILQRTLPDPLTNRSLSDTFEGGLGYSTLLGDWQFSATSNATYAISNTRVDRRRGTDLTVDIRDAVASGALAIDGALPFVPGAGVDTAQTRQLTLSNLATLSGKAFRLPGGEANVTLKAGYDYSRSINEDTRNALGSVTLKRGDVLGGVNLALPLTSKNEDFLGAIGDISLNFSGGLDHLSDFGTLKDWSAGVTWSPTDKLSFQATYIVDEEAPQLTQLAAPNILTYNSAVYDFIQNRTALVTVTSGGNPNLKKETQRDWKISGQWQLPFMERSSLIVEYFRNRSSDVSQSFPLLTPAIEAAFPDRVTRDSAGNLIAIDRRPVTFDEVKSSSLRWGINLSGSLGSSSSKQSAGGNGNPDTARPASAPYAPAAGPNGPMPGAGAEGQRSGPMDGGRFSAFREQLCAPNAGEPDLAAMPDGMRQRILGADGKVDPAKLAEMKQRVCSADGARGPRGEGGQGAPDPQRFERIRTALCAGGSGAPDVASLPERMRQQLIGADGKIDQTQLAQLRERFCNATPPAPSGETKPSGEGMRSPRGPVAGAGGPAGLGGPGGARGPGSRWNLAVYHTYRFTDTVRIAPGVPLLDQLDGDAIGAGGTPRHAIEGEGGVFKNGYGLRLKAKWNAPATVNGSGLPGSSDLRFGSTFDLSLRTFADLGRDENLVAKFPFLKGSRLSFVVDNILDSRQKVTNEMGVIPIAYQRGYRDPQGRVIGIDFRKQF